MSTTPNQKDLLAKKTDLEGILKPDANDVLHLPDITITLAENGQFYLAGISKKLLTLIGNTSGNAVTLDGDAGLTFSTSGGSSTITGISDSSGNSSRIYIDKSTNKTYRWSGTAYVEISESIALGETSSTAYRGDRGKIAYDHSQSAHAPSNAEANQNAFSNVKIDSDIINASAKTDTLEFIAGDNIILTPNVSNKKITVSQVPVRKTASGDIASFSDGTGDPFLKVKANINPVQDLHGYDNPWVGGAGKNKIDVPNGKVTSLGYIFNLADLNLPAGTYTLSGQGNPALQQAIASFAVVTGSTTPINKAISTPFTFTAENNITGMRLYVATSCEYYNIQLEEGSTATSYAPYENICPISGWDEAQITVADDLTTPTETHTTSIPFHDNSDNPITVYGGTLNVTSGELRVTYANIASYNGETINEPWISSMDVYSAGATPTTGAQVVYPLATPQTYQLTPAQVATLLGQNNIFADCGQIEVAYKTPFYTDLTTKNEVQVLINESITSALNASY